MPSGTTCNLFPDSMNHISMDEAMASLICLKIDLNNNQVSKEDVSERLQGIKQLIDILSDYHSNAVDTVESDGYDKIITNGFIDDTLDNAKKAKKYFLSDYEMYKSYCSQWDGNNIKVCPVSEDVYLSL